MKDKTWIILPVILLAAAFLFLFLLDGYGFIGLLLVLAAAAAVLCHFSGRKARRIYMGIIAAAAVFLIVIEIPIIKAARTDAPEGCDYIIVLGAGVNGKTPSLSLVNRLDAALIYLEDNPETVVIVSGGQGPGENITEARAMGIWLEARGISPERIIQEPNAASTRENLAFSFDIIRIGGDTPDNVAVVSSEYHLYRAKLLAETLGVSVSGIAGETSLPVLKLNYFIREAGARLYYLIFGVV